MSEDVSGVDRSDPDDYPLDNHDGAVSEMGSGTADNPVVNQQFQTQ